MMLSWLPVVTDWRARLRALAAAPDWAAAVALANHRLDFIQTNALDHVLRKAFAVPPASLATRPVRLAILGSSTTLHLHAGIRVAGLRRGIHITVFEPDYGQYWQELSDPGSALHDFRPDAILFALDAYHLTAGASARLTQPEADGLVDAKLAHLANCWSLARDAFGGAILQQTPLPILPNLLGDNEHRLPGAPASILARITASLRADTAGVDLVAIDGAAARDGIAAWHDPAMWHRAKQEIAVQAAPAYGEHVARSLAARQGRAAKCLVLDLDNTIWGGVIGDDGMDGIVLGQGNALGEAFVAVQNYARELSRRGIILAVCSKNDDDRAREPFLRHPDMVLRLSDIACFVANWEDKATNMRAIAQALNIGLDSLVFLDDNPFERNLVRRELPMVLVPEAPDDPALVPQCLADAGYFETLAVTDDDRARAAQYQDNLTRSALRANATDLDAYLRGLDMRLTWRRVDTLSLARTTQLINKTNQFNLTTRRYGEAEVAALAADPAGFALALRLIDCFGDNGVIAVIIGRPSGPDIEIDSWLMSCRVLGRGVEATCLNLVAAAAAARGAQRLIGIYRPTAKNAMVAEHYPGLGFSVIERGADGSRFALSLANFVPAATFIATEEEIT